jgi:hypothetical protein
MALDNVDANIPLQAGRNLPTFGPNMQQVAEMQKVAIAIQNAHQVQQAQNALKSLYADPKNYDPKTMQPTQDAWGALFRASPPAGMDLRNNLATLQQKAAVTQNQQNEASQGWIKRAATDVGKPALDEYNAALEEGVPPSVAMQRAQQKYTDGSKTLMDAGMPDVLKQQMSPTFDPIRIGKNLQTIQQQQQAEKLKSEGYVKTIEQGPGGPVEFWANPDPKKPPLSIGGTPLAQPPTGVPTTAGKELSPSKEIAVLDKDGNVISRMAAREDVKQAGKWVRSDNGAPVDIPTGGRIDVGQTANMVVLGGREATLLQRQLGAGIQSVKALKDIVSLPSDSSAGFFGGRGQAPGLLNAAKETLTNTVTSQDVQDYNALMPGVARSLAFIESQGLAPGQKFTDSFNAEMLKEGDTVKTKMLKLARQREIVDAGMETLLTNRRLGEEQRKAAQQVMDNLAEIVPWTPAQVIQLDRAKPGQTLRDMGVGGTGQQGKEVPVAANGIAKPQTPDEAKALPPGTQYMTPDGRIMVR